MRNGLSLAAFLALMLGGGTAIGFLTLPGDWYAGLEKPTFNPPNWIFAPVWTTLYVLIAVAGWRIWVKARSSAAMLLWRAQLALNFAWSPVFFGAHQIGAALAIIVALFAAILLFIANAWRHDRSAALLFAPYALWVGFASVLNGAIFALN
ncbi:MAG: TspO/MBR family protein [Hyphomonadaceae bacterium]